MKRLILRALRSILHVPSSTAWLYLLHSDPVYLWAYSSERELFKDLIFIFRVMKLWESSSLMHRKVYVWMLSPLCFRESYAGRQSSLKVFLPWQEYSMSWTTPMTFCRTVCRYFWFQFGSKHINICEKSHEMFPLRQ